MPGSGITDDYLYDLDGRYITQVSGGGFWIRGEIYAGGRHLATYENDLGTPTTFFEHTDWLGTERVETAVNGSSCETISSLPFGDGMNEAGSCDPTALRFSGKERDWESNLDNFGARYYSSNLGRWQSPDWSSVPAPVPYANLTNPQTLNLYAMVSDNPETFADLDGHEAAITAPTAGGGMDLTGVGSEVSGDLAGFDDNMGAPQYNSTPSENQNQAQQQNGTQFSPTDPTSLRKGKAEPGPNGGIIQDYQVVDAHGHPVRKVSVQEHVKVLVHENVNAAANPNPVYYPTGEVRDEIGPTSPPSTITQHEFLKTEQTFTAYKNGHAYPLTTVINQYVDVNKGRVTAETVVVVP